jgi:hypothetical protein
MIQKWVGTDKKYMKLYSFLEDAVVLRSYKNFGFYKTCAKVQQAEQ